MQVLVKSTVLKAWNVPQMDDGMAKHTYAVRIKGAWEFLQSSSFNIYQNVNEKQILLPQYMELLWIKKRGNALNINSQLPQRLQ